MRIGLSYDLKEKVTLDQTSPEDALEEYDSIETIELIATALKAGGEVVMLGGGREFLANILREHVDIVFNIAEGRGTFRSREAQVPSILEMLDIPYSGSDPECLAICLDKPLTKQLLSAAGIHTPRWQVIRNSRELQQVSCNKFPYPAIAKPAYEGSSKGVRLNSVVESPEQAVETIGKLLQYYHQPVMVEQFISGDEVTIGVAGNSPPKIVGMMRILPKKKTEHFVYSIEVKRDYKNLVDYECPARLSSEILDQLKTFSLKSFDLLGCRDFARIDFRLGADDKAYFIEINPLPGLGNHSDLVIMALKMGWTYQQLINTVINAALERYPRCTCV